jgi:large-conductance mechanosensitive channel
MINFLDTTTKEVIFTVLLTMASGLSIRIMLSLVKQRWVSTYHHTMSYILLPVITFTITKVITGNIALSLGMIGALSIVRFRNPVKNPFELVIFFALITIGISMSVNIKWGLLLVVVINFSIIASYVFESIARVFNLHIFSLSFDEGNSNNIIEIQSSKQIDSLHGNKLLLQYVNDNLSQEFHYRLASKSRADIENIRKSIQSIQSIQNIEIRFN